MNARSLARLEALLRPVARESNTLVFVYAVPEGFRCGENIFASLEAYAAATPELFRDGDETSVVVVDTPARRNTDLIWRNVRLYRDGRATWGQRQTLAATGEGKQ